MILFGIKGLLNYGPSTPDVSFTCLSTPDLACIPCSLDDFILPLVSLLVALVALSRCLRAERPFDVGMSSGTLWLSACCIVNDVSVRAWL